MCNTTKLLIISASIIIFLIILLLIIPKTREFICRFFELLIDCSVSSLAIVLLFMIFIAITIILNGIFNRTLINKTSYTETNNIQTEKEIFSLDLNYESGSFTLGVYNVETDFYFYFLTKENNQYKLEKLNSETAYLEETNDGNPRLTYTEESKILITEYTPTKTGEFLGLKKEKYTNVQSKNIKKTIHIPKNSLIKEYKPTTK